jgi:signal transduction histidine kinase
VYADPGQVGRVLTNLVSNALKYSEGGIEVTARSDPGRGLILTEVSDSGPGIPPQRKHDIFNKFARLKTGKTRGREGSGLGLAICKSIVESHRGEIGVESVEGKGSLFWFGLPAEPVSRPEASQ